MKKLHFATSNKGKMKELQAILEVPLEIVPIHLDEVQSLDIEYVARKKAEEAYEKIKKPVIVDDVGLYIEHWKGLPGPFIKHFFDTLSYKGFFDQFENVSNKNIKAVGTIAYHDGKKIHVFSGEFQGKILVGGKGQNGFGFDPYVIPNGYDKTFAEMDESLKNRISHRANAAFNFKKFLDSQKKQNKI